MSSSSSDSEDENIALLRQAVDTDFICDGMFTKGASSTDEVATKAATDESQSDVKKLIIPPTALKSQRHIDQDVIEADLNVSKSMQDFVYKKMSKKIAESIEFVEVSSKKSKKKNETSSLGCVRLLKGTDPITQIDETIKSDKSAPRQKISVKRRVVEPDGYNDETKLEMAVIEGDSILQQTEIKGWKAKKIKPNKLFKYREKNAILYEIEAENEFTALRKKNNWSEGKIANRKNHK